jgi:DUF1365 family protein
MVRSVVTSREDPTTSPAPLSCVPALYATEIAHTRRAPIVNSFHYRASYWLVDFDRLPRPRGIVKYLARFERGDHSDVRAFLIERGVVAERILMLAMTRTLGYVFNPISVFWCYDAAGESVGVVAEVHNTYGGRHTYFLRPGEHGYSEVKKAMYVSPFYPVDGYYHIRVSEPGRSVSVTVALHRGDDEPFVATLEGQRLDASNLNVVKASFAYSALRVTILIRWQAARLWLRGLKVKPR